MSDDFFADGTYFVVDFSCITHELVVGFKNPFIHFIFSVSNVDVDVPVADNAGTVNEVR